MDVMDVIDPVFHGSNFIYTPHIVSETDASLASLASLASVSLLTRPNIITLFISAHAVDDIIPYRPFGAEVRLVLSQSRCGYSSFENPESIREKIDFWYKKFAEQHGPTVQTLVDGISEFNDSHHIDRDEIKIELINYKDNQVDVELDTIDNTREKITCYKQILSSMIYIFKEEQLRKINMIDSFITEAIFLYEEDGSTTYIQAYANQFIAIAKQLIKEKNLTYAKVLDYIRELNRVEILETSSGTILPSFLKKVVNKWIVHKRNNSIEQSTNFFSMANVVNERVYTFEPNYDESKSSAENSQYGIHVLYDTMFPLVYNKDRRNNYIVKTRKLVEYHKKTISIAPGLQLKDGVITLSDIVTFLQKYGYDIINIIDTGCRNLDAKSTCGITDEACLAIAKEIDSHQKTTEFSNFGLKKYKKRNRKSACTKRNRRSCTKKIFVKK